MRKLALMHAEYGKRPGHTCRECCNCVHGEYHGEYFIKCRVYGFTHSADSDWSLQYEACGRLNKPFDKEKENSLGEEATRTDNKDRSQMRLREKKSC